MTEDTHQYLSDFEGIYNEHTKTSRLKRSFIVGSLKKKTLETLQKYGITDETLLKSLYTHKKLSELTSESQREYTKFLMKILDQGIVRVFMFLSCVLDDQTPIDDKYLSISFFNEFFEELFKRNKIADNRKIDWPELMADWKQPGIPYLIESLVQLISAEKLKVFIKNALYSETGMCWILSADASIELSRRAFDTFENFEYSDLPLSYISEKISTRARIVASITHEKAKSLGLPEYREYNGQPGVYPGYFPVAGAAATGAINFIKEFRIISRETQAVQIFRRYLEGSSFRATPVEKQMQEMKSQSNKQVGEEENPKVRARYHPANVLHALISVTASLRKDYCLGSCSVIN